MAIRLFHTKRNSANVSHVGIDHIALLDYHFWKPLAKKIWKDIYIPNLKYILMALKHFIKK